MTTRFTLAVSALASILATAATAVAAERQKVSPTIIPKFDQPDLSAANASYTLSADELKLDCRRLTGRVAIRIRQLRSTSADTPTSALSRGMQQAATPFVAGTSRGIDPAGDNARDLAMIKAYNAQLAAKGCKTFDVEAQLKPGASAPPQPLAASKPASGKPAAPTVPAAKAP